MSPAPGSTAPLPRQEIHALFIGLMLIMFLAALDQSIIAPALPTIARELGQFEAMAWVVTAYLLSATAITPVVGALSDIHGRRRVIVTSVVVFLVGSVLCAMATSMWWLVAARAVQGLGGGGLIALGNTVIADVVSPRERGRYQGYIAGMYASAGVAGPLVGGMFAEYLSWTLVFWINLPLGALALWLSDRVLRRLPVRASTRRVDYPGAVLLVGATITLLLALSWGGQIYPWGSVPVLALFAGAVVLTTLFVRRQRRAVEPLLPLALFASPVVRMTALSAVVVMMVNIGLSIYVPLYLELDRGLPASQSGLVLITLILGVVVGAFTTGLYMRRTGRYRPPPRIGLAVAIAGLAWLSFDIQNLPPLAIAASLALVGYGLGTSMPVMMVSTQNAVDPRNMGIATASHSFFRMLGNVIGAALGGALILRGPVEGGHEMVRAADLSAAAVASMQQSYAWLFGSGAVLLTVAWVALQIMPELSLKQRPAGASEASAQGE